jgi:hypothetical protein
VENSVSIPKINSTNYTYLGCANVSKNTSGIPNTRVVSPSAPLVCRVARPVAVENNQSEEMKLSNIIGKTNKIPISKTTSSFTLEDLLPPVQQAPIKHSGESNLKCKFYRFKNTNYKYK